MAFHHNNGRGAPFLTFHPIASLYYTDHVLEIKTDQMDNIKFQQGRRGEILYVEIWSQIIIKFNYCDFKVKTQEITYISLQQGMGSILVVEMGSSATWFTLPIVI